MNRIIALVAFATIVFAAPVLHADSGAMSLEEVMQTASQGPQVRLSRARARGAAAAATLERQAAYLPTLSVGASASMRDRSFSLATPMGDLPLGDRSSLNAQVRVSQPVVDLSRLLYTSVAAKHDATAASLLSKHSAEEMAMVAAEQYLDVLVIAAKARANDAFVLNLAGRLEEVKAMVVVERTVIADQLRVDLALQNAQQQSLVLDNKSKLAKLSLARTLGRNDPIEPKSLSNEWLHLDPKVPHQLGSRRDLLALRTQERAARKRLSGIRSELIPTVVLQGDYVYSDAGPQSEKSFFQGTINLRWIPYAAGSRSSRKLIREAEIVGLRRQYEDAERGAKLQLEAGHTSLAIANGYVAVAQKAVAQSQEAARITSERYRSGLEKVGDLLEAQALVRDSQMQAEVAALERVRALLQLRFASGQTMLP